MAALEFDAFERAARKRDDAATRACFVATHCHLCHGRSKYRNTKCEHDGIRFDSKRERSRWFELIKQQDVGLISGLRRQVVFELAPGVVIASRKRPALRYIADFVYTRDGVQIVEDVKGAITGEYRIKRHLMKSVHDIDISEIK